MKSVCAASNTLEMTNMSVDQDKKIAKSIKDGNYYRFKEIIDSDAILNADDILFQICSNNSLEEGQRCQFAASLLSKYAAHGKNASTNSYPLHMAAERGLNKLLKTLLTHPINRADPNVLTTSGETAIYWAVRGAASRKVHEKALEYDSALECVKLLTDYGCDLFTRSNQGCKFTPVHLAAQHKMWHIVDHFLECKANIDLEINNTTARKLYSEFNSCRVMDYVGNDNSGDDDRKGLFDLMENWRESVSKEDKEVAFASFLENNPEFDLRVNEIYKGKYTLLECAVKNGLRGAAKTLINYNKDPANPNQALFAALEKGEEFFEILRESKMQIDVSKKVNGAGNYTVLHKAVLSTNPSADVIKSILQMGEEKFGSGFAQWVNSQDYRGFTALHYAAKRHLGDEVQALLQSPANIFLPDRMGVPAFYYIRPEVVEAYFDDKIKMTDNSVIDDGYGVTFDYNFMDTSKITQMKQNKDLPACQSVMSLCKRTVTPALVRTPAARTGVRSNALAPALGNTEASATTLTVSSTDWQAGLPKDATRNQDGNEGGYKDEKIKENEFMREIGPLKLLASSPRHKHLVMHPIVTSFLHLKWKRLYWLYWLNFVFYLAFMVFLTLFLFTLDFVNMSGNDDISKNLANESEIKIKIKNKDFIPEDANNYTFIGVGTCIFTVILLIREVFQVAFMRQKYFMRLENYLEIFIVVATLWLLSSPNNVILSAFLYLLASLEFVLLMGKHPRMATNIKMFTTVSINFIKFFLWYLVLIFAFAVSFYMILNKNDGECGENIFETLPRSIFKTIIMISGEYDAGEINFDHASVASHIIFIAFLFLIPIVMINLLNGLAVSDTQEIRNMAELKFYKTQIEFFSDVESNYNSLQNLSAHFYFTGRSFVILNNCLPYNRMIVYLNKDNKTEPGVSQWGEMNGCFCCTVRKYPHFIKNACNVYNKIVEKAVQVANASNAEEDKMDQILKRLAHLEKLIEENAGVMKK